MTGTGRGAGAVCALAATLLAAPAPGRAAQDPGYRPAGGTIESLTNASGLELRILLDSAALGGPELELALLTLPAGHAGGPHRHGAVEVFYVLEGELEHVVEGRSHRLGPGMVGVVRPGDAVRHVVVSDGPVRVLVAWAPGGEAARLRPYFRVTPSGAGVEGAAADTAGRPVAFVDVNVVPMDRERVLEHQTVVVAGDTIQAVGPAARVHVPAGARVVDGRGLHLLPGLMDLHVHLGEPDQLALYLANGVTTIRNLGGVDGILALRDSIARGERPGPTLYTSGNFLDGDPPFRPINTVLRTPADAEAEVAAQAAAGFDFIKVYGRLGAPEFDAVVAAAARHGIPVTGHVPGPVGLEGVLAAGVSDIAHVAQLVLGGARAETVPATAARGLVGSGAAIVSTLVMFDRMVFMRGNQPGLDSLLAAPWARYLSPGTRRWWVESNPVVGLSAAGGPGDLYALTREVIPALRDAGAELLLGTDAGLWGNAPGFSVHEELALLVASGLTPYQALRAATADAGAYLARSVRPRRVVGRIEPGAVADLLLVRGDPLADVAAAAAIEGVMSRGAWLPRARLDRMLQELADRYEAAESPR